MAETPNFDDLVNWSESSGDAASRPDQTEPTLPLRRDRRRPPRRRRLTWLWVLLTVLALIVADGAVVWTNFQPQVRHLMGWEAPVDYVGAGSGDVVVTITNGQIGSDVATLLQKAGVTKTYTAFYKLLLVQDPPVQFHPGSYKLKKKMSASSALKALTDPANKVQTRLVVPEGTTVAGVVKRLAALSESTGITADQAQAAADDYTSYGLPAEAPRLEGYLFPATYNLEPGMSAHDVFQTMVSKMFQVLDAAGVAPADRHRVLTLASITQKEGGPEADFPKVARVWENRIAQGMNLQSDATVSYGAGGTTISTSDSERADKTNRYNTYANPGLPVGPISNPGDAAINATLHPADGPWLYFVLVNGETGETVFSSTFEEHNVAVKRWQQWLRDHPGFDQ
ncbi:endolytic transglycosylase MltG [Parafrigoribacterium mesophilum]|uniref:endolytic transglycosylase MltG n=1 Tax=Parafrigoribacterium mesophilum TaxID=433646 RepID=UPI0031FCD838